MTRSQRLWIVGGALALAAGIAVGLFVLRPLPYEDWIEDGGPMVTPAPTTPAPQEPAEPAQPIEPVDPVPPSPDPQPPPERPAGYTAKGNIVLESPRPNALVQSPLVVTGRARGSWYFEAEFPVRLLDAEGNEIVWASGRAQGEWMTPDFVPFEAALTFEPPEGDAGVLVLERSNASGLPEHDAALRVPVRFR